MGFPLKIARRSLNHAIFSSLRDAERKRLDDERSLPPFASLNI
ncbi:MAG: hypothetical protein V7K38_28630 [Nostoc sp.]